MPVRIVTVMVIVSLRLAPAGAEPPPPLSLRAAVDEALTRNDRILDAHDQAEQADLQVTLARNAFHPRIVPNLSGALGAGDLPDQTYRVDVYQKLPFGTEIRGGVGSTSQRNQLGLYYTSDTTLEVRQSLLRGWGGGASRMAVTSARERRQDAARHRAAAEQRLAVDVATAYFRIVASLGLAEAAEKSLERSQHLAASSEAKLETGKVSQLDVARARQLVMQAEAQLLDAHATIADAKDSLRLLLARDGAADFEVVRQIPHVVEPMSEEEAAALALQHRLELTSARASAVEAERLTAFSKNQLLPQLDLSLALTRRETGDNLTGSLGLDRFQTAAFFNVSMPVDRTPQKVDYSRTLIDRDRRRREAKALERQIAGDARAAARLQTRLIRSLGMADTALQLAREELEVAQLRYERGLSNNLDVVTAETNLLAAEGRRLSTAADLAVARLRLRATLGVLEPRNDVGALP